MIASESGDTHGQPGSQPGSQQGGIARTAALLGGFALVSRVLGLLRDMSMAWLVGGGAAADALVAAMRLPHVLRRMLGEGSLSMTLTASLVHLERLGVAQSHAAGLQRSRSMRLLAQALATRLGLVLALITALGMVGSPWLAEVLAPGFYGPERQEAIYLLRICLPYTLAAGMAALGMALLHSLGVFWLPAASPALFNIVILLFAAAAGLGLLPAAPALAVGMLCGGLAQWFAQWLAVRRLLPPVHAHRAASIDAGQDKEQAALHSRAASLAWKCLGRLPAGLLGASAPQLAMLAAMSLASSLGRGQVAALYYAERLLELPLGLVGVCLGMASLPTLSRLAAAKDFALFSDQLRTALRLTLLLSLPAAAGLWAVGPRLVEGLLRHGAFGDNAAYETGLALWAYLPGLPAFAVNRSLLAACNALGEVRRTAVSAVWAVVATLAVGAALVHSLSGSLGVMAPALAVSLGLWLQCGFLLYILASSLKKNSLGAATGPSAGLACLPGAASVLRQCAAAAATALAAWQLLECLRGYGIWLELAVAIAGGAAAWLLCLLALRDGDALVAVRALVHRLHGRPH
ncbi:MAG: murein biosynthesis integral membrane protein MurJ [Desulfovibrio sp.]|uniref:murein biosynthesis integral membrane protein MurJ n=1 Tax=Desulfovibrio sp. TaxID=885 RepID=UPI00135E9C2D|nr:murein biosynthesis integral membrane protein MurJ [Desulfovibrio sp.]MTJ91749.1 murein biosynthesis integral membrane protein MurJ [Desulfovibrio sp.]